MSTKFLTSTGSNSSLSDGSANVFVNSISASSLSASMPVKTNGVNQLISSNLDILEASLNNGNNIPLVLSMPCFSIESDKSFSITRVT